MFISLFCSGGYVLFFRIIKDRHYHQNDTGISSVPTFYVALVNSIVDKVRNDTKCCTQFSRLTDNLLDSHCDANYPLSLVFLSIYKLLGLECFWIISMMKVLRGFTLFQDKQTLKEPS